VSVKKWRNPNTCPLELRADLSPRPPKKAVAASGTHKLRIIGGRWRSRNLVFPAVEGLRPTGDRIRETLFNWLMPELPGSRCLDLFAGSGILGFEALSRGASHCTLVELNPTALRQLDANAQLLGASNAHIAAGNAVDLLQHVPMNTFDLVFIDPPFAADLWLPVMELLARGWLRNGTLVYVETPRETVLPLGPAWHLHRQKQAGQVCYSLYRFETNVRPPM
jgi:16S rRNA (guanine966-N2)-methyltransferase